jgi:hypothetical protein
MYGRDLDTQAILEGKVPVPPAARQFLATIRNTMGKPKEAKAA